MNTAVAKPVVHYIGDAEPHGTSALLRPVNHPNHLAQHNVSNTMTVFTSAVVSWDKQTGRIETQNTIYMPQRVEAA